MGWLSLIGSGVSALSEYSQGQKDQQAADQEATYVQASALADAKRIRKLTREAQGEATAGQAASGVDVTSGSPLEVQRDIGKRGEMDAHTTLLNADTQAAMLRKYGKASANNATANAGSMLAEGLYKYGSRWKRSSNSTDGGSV